MSAISVASSPGVVASPVSISGAMRARGRAGSAVGRRLSFGSRFIFRGSFILFGSHPVGVPGRRRGVLVFFLGEPGCEMGGRRLGRRF